MLDKGKVVSSLDASGGHVLPSATLERRSPLSRLFRQFLAYIIVGGIAFACDFAILYGLTEFLRFHYLISASAGFLAGLVTNYLLCISFIFDYRALSNTAHEFLLFFAIGVVGLALNNLLLYALTDGAGLHYLNSKLVAAGIVLIFNFVSRRHLLFSESSSAKRLLGLPSTPSES